MTNLLGELCHCSQNFVFKICVLFLSIELEKLRKRQIKSHKRLGSIKERVRAAVVSQFKDIIQEVSTKDIFIRVGR